MRLRNSIRTFSSGFGCLVLTMGIGFIVTPRILHWLGAEKFGSARLVMDWLGYLALLELGLSDATFPLLAADVGPERRRNALRTAMSGYLGVLPWKLLLGAGLVIFIPKLVHGATPGHHEIRLACLIGLGLGLVAPLLPFRTVLEAGQKGYQVNLLLLGQSMVTAVFALEFARAGYGIWGQVLAALVAGIAFHAGLTWMAIRGEPDIAVGLFPLRADPQSRDELRRHQGPMIVSGICSRLSLMSDSLIIGYFLSPASVSSLFVTQRLISAVQPQLYAVGNSTWAGLLELHRQEDASGGGARPGAMGGRLIELTLITVTLGIVILGPIVVFNAFFVRQWVGAAQFGGVWLGVITALNGILLAVTALWSWIFLPSGKVKVLLPQYLAFTALNLALSIGLTPWIGICGPPLGTLLAGIMTSFWSISRHLDREFRVPAGELRWAFIRPFLVLLPAAGALALGAREYPPVGWLSLGSCLALSSTVLAVIAWRGVFVAEDRRRWRSRWEDWRKSRRSAARSSLV